MHLSELESQRVAIWGAGREGLAAHRLLRQKYPDKFLTIFCTPSEQSMLQNEIDRYTHCITQSPTVSLLTIFDVIIKSPGISAHHPAITEATQHGVQITSGTALWFAKHQRAPIIAITGTKGKSTTAALIAFLLRKAGSRVVLCGNIGVPLLSVYDIEAPPDWWVMELSSFQTRELSTPPGIAVLLNLFPEHLDWHGSLENYYSDKTKLLGDAQHFPKTNILNFDQGVLAKYAGHLPQENILWFNQPEGFHVKKNAIYFQEHAILSRADLKLRGRHNASNICAALTVMQTLHLNAFAMASFVTQFHPLPHRMQSLGINNDIEWVNDSIATTPHATIAALEHFQQRAVTLLLGGYDRGVEWDTFAEAIHTQTPRTIIAFGACGQRIFDLLLPRLPHHCALILANDLRDAMTKAHQLTPRKGIVLLSPGAPSFDAYKDYTERGRHFAKLAGFDPDKILSIDGLGL